MPIPILQRHVNESQHVRGFWISVFIQRLRQSQLHVHLHIPFTSRNLQFIVLQYFQQRVKTGTELLMKKLFGELVLSQLQDSTLGFHQFIINGIIFLQPLCYFLWSGIRLALTRSEQGFYHGMSHITLYGLHICHLSLALRSDIQHPFHQEIKRILSQGGNAGRTQMIWPLKFAGMIKLNLCCRFLSVHYLHIQKFLLIYLRSPDKFV